MPKKEQHLGIKLREAMELRELKNQAAIARYFGVSAPTVSGSWLKHGRIGKEHYPNLVRYFELPYEWWFGSPAVGFPEAVRSGMRRAGLTINVVATELGVTEHTVEDWIGGKTMPADSKMKRLARMIGVEPGALREASKGTPIVLSQMQGEHVTDEDELRLLQAYRGLEKPWAKTALRRRAVELLEEFGKRGVKNPWAETPGSTQ